MNEDTHWTEETEDRLIDLWQENQCLYAVSSVACNGPGRAKSRICIKTGRGGTGQYHGSSWVRL